MKQRFSSLDIKVLSHELSQTLVGFRTHNIYDLSTRIFLFKFQKPGHREQFIIDSGFRCHLTGFVRTTAAEPSVFVRRLRKLIGTRRVTSVQQIGTDRIIEFQFSEGLYRLYLEFYAGGNIIITDGEQTVLAALRTVSEGADHDAVKLGDKYNLESRQNYAGVSELTTERIKKGLESVLAKSKDELAKARKKNTQLRRALALAVTEFPPVLVDHALTMSGFDGSLAPEEVIGNLEVLNKLLEALKEAQKVVAEITSSEKVKGYIIAKKRKTISSEIRESTKEHLLYDDFQPFKPMQFESNPEIAYVEIEGFNRTVDEFYSSIEGQRLDSKLEERELAAKKRLEDTKRIHQERLGSLQQAQELNYRKAEAIQANVERVQEATVAVNGLIAQAMDWVDIGRLIETEQGRGNPVAQLIKLPLKLYENTITLLLAEPEADDEDSGYAGSETHDDSSESGDEGQQAQSASRTAPKQDMRLTIDIDLSLSPWANASQYFDQKKAAAEKEGKTAQASTVALKSAERKIVADLKKGLSKEKDVLRPLRQPFWFEKFYYFISSDGYLILAGKDTSQNDMLYAKYFKRGDIFVHADINGAATVIIKNQTDAADAPIPPSTLQQAGTFSVVSSSAWDTKGLMAAWWVKFDQVSKLGSQGEFLGPGQFTIAGEKTFLPPAQMLVGFGIIFEITEKSKAQHKKHRVEAPSVEENKVSVQQDDEFTRGEDSEKEFSDTKQNTLEEDDSDEDFPDAAPPAKIDSDDEDFPDVNPTTVDSDDEDDNAVTNPLQPSKSEDQDRQPLTKELPIRSTDDLDDTASVATETTISSNTPGRRHLSAKERRLLKKGISPSTLPTSSRVSDLSAPAALDITAANYDDGDDAVSITSTAAAAKPGSVAPLPRGKRTKLKKAAAKYAEQSEEDRAAALAKLGSQGIGDRKAAEEAERVAKAEAEAQAKQRRREQHLRAQALGRAAEEARRAGQLGEEEGEDVLQDLAILDRLVGKLLPGDEVVCAIPVCAPWTALSNVKFKAKMQPGPIKKGRASREVLGKWQADGKAARNVDPKSEDVDRIWPREKELIEGMKETEIVAVMSVSRVKVIMSGGSAGGGKDGKGKGPAKGKGGIRGGRGKKK